MKRIIRLAAIVALCNCFLARGGEVGAADFMVSKTMWLQALTAVKKFADSVESRGDVTKEHVLVTALIYSSSEMEKGVKSSSGKAQATKLAIANLLREYALNLYPVTGKDDKETVLKIAAKNVRERTPFTLLLGDDAFLAPWKTFREACEELNLPAPAATLL